MADQFNSPMQSYEGWNVNAPYLSPSYMSNFRPAYGHDGMRDNPFARHTSVRESIAGLGPADYAYGADSLQESSAHMYNVATGAGDAGVSLFQKVGIPAAAWYGVSKMTGSRFGGSGTIAGRFGSLMGQGVTRGATGMAGRGMDMLGMGSLAARGGGLATRMAAGAGSLGSLASGMFLPIMAAQAASSIADSALIDPYVSTRRGMDAMRANTANQFISGEGQTASGGFGMSATRAQNISQALTEAGQGDMSLSGGKYNEIADNMMRAGIFQEVGDMDTTRIVDGVKKATSVLKLISRVTGDSDILAGIQTLATLKSGGLDDIQKMERAVNQLRGNSAASGVGMQQIMDTVGIQGQVMAQQQGMRGVTGLLASADAFAGFTNARRAGLISGGQMQALGGAEGMTQNLMSGAYHMMNSGYGRMTMQSGGQFGGGVSDTISNWGESFSDNPLQSQGNWYANQGVYKENAMNDQGPTAIMLETLKSKAISMGQDPDDGMVIAAMAQAEGLDPMQFRSMAEADRARQDPISRMRMSESRRTSNRSDYASYLQQEGLGMRGIPLLGAAQEMWMQGSREFLRGGAELMAPVTEGIASASDYIEETLASTKGLMRDKDQSYMIKQGASSVKAKFVGYSVSKGKSGRGGRVRGEGELHRSDKQAGTISKLNYLLNNGSPEIKVKARQALEALLNKRNDEFIKIYSELDVESRGSLSGSETGFRQEAHLEEIRDIVDSGQLQAETTSLRFEKVERTMSTELSEAMRSDNPAAAIDALVDKDGGSKDLLRTLGISSDSLRGKSAAERKSSIADKALDWKNRKMSDIEGSDAEREREFYRRYQEAGFSQNQIENYLQSTGAETDAIVEDLNPFFGSANAAFQKHSEGIAADIEARKKADAGGSTTDWSSLRDVTDGIGKLGPAMTMNTDAIQTNTNALIASINANNGFATDVTLEDFQPAVPTEPIVGVPGTTKNTNVQRYR